jgi:hypothetical protein
MIHSDVVGSRDSHNDLGVIPRTLRDEVAAPVKPVPSGIDEVAVSLWVIDLGPNMALVGLGSILVIQVEQIARLEPLVPLDFGELDVSLNEAWGRGHTFVRTSHIEFDALEWFVCAVSAGWAVVIARPAPLILPLMSAPLTTVKVGVETWISV